MNPHFDEFTCLLIQIFALDVEYEGDPEGARPGTVLPRQGRESLALEKENQMGWAAVNLFRGSQTVNSGIHYLPVLQQQPSLVRRSSTVDSVPITRNSFPTKFLVRVFSLKKKSPTITGVVVFFQFTLDGQLCLFLAEIFFPDITFSKFGYNVFKVRI